MNRRSAFVVMILWLAVIMAFWLVIKIDQKVRNGQSQEVTSKSHLVETPYFSVTLPANWEFEELVGIDSYVAIIQGPNAVIVINYGEYAEPLEYEDGPGYRVENRLVGNFMPKIVISKRARGVTGIHFAQLPNNQKLTMSADNLTDEQKIIVLSIFYSIRIKMKIIIF